MPGRKHAPLIVRFKEKFHEGEPHECWEWTSNRNGVGYGLIYDNERRRKMLAHRVAYEFHHECKLPFGREVVIMHTCDNPSCVNPGHLTPGTMKTNYADMATKGRRRVVSTYANLGAPRKGSAAHNAKLTEDMVRQIRAEMEAGVAVRAIARRLGMDRKTISNIRDRKGWTHV